MEPSTTHRPQGVAREPGGPRGRPRPRDPDPRARVRRLRQRGREVPRRRDAEETEFIGFRLKQGVYGQRQPDVQMCRVKLPLGGVTPEQMDTFARRRRALGAARQGAHHDAPEHPDPPRPAARHGGADPRDLRRRPVEPRGLRQHRPQRDGRPVGRRLPRRAVGPDALRRRLRALLRAPPDDAADAAQGQDRVHRLRHRPRADRHPRHRVHRARARRRARASRSASAAARRSCRASRRRWSTSSPPTTASTSSGPRPSSASSTARTGCASTAPAPGSRCWSTRSASTRCASMVDEELQGDWVAERDFSIDHRLFLHDEEANAPAPPLGVRLAERRRLGVRALPRGERRAPAPGRASPPSRSRWSRGDLTPEQFRGLAAIMREYCGGYARTTVHQNLLLRWVRDEAVYDVWRRLRGARARRRRRRRDQRRRLLPRHRLLQARHHELDGPQPRGAGADRGDGDHRPADAPDPHQDVRLPERLQPAPHRQHRVLRRVDQGRRAHDPRLRGAHRRQLRGRRDRLRRAAEGAAARQAGARGGRALAAQVRGRARGRRGLQRLRRARRDDGVRGRGARPRHARRVRPGDDEPSSSTGTARSRSRSSAAKASARSEACRPR